MRRLAARSCGRWSCCNWGQGMATQTLACEKLAAAEWEMGTSRGELRPRTDRHKLLPLPNEHIYLYRKAIDNSRVVRQADPRARAICWRRIATTTAGTLVLVALLWPGMYGMLAGYQIESLKAQQQKLIAEKTTAGRRGGAPVEPRAAGRVGTGAAVHRAGSGTGRVSSPQVGRLTGFERPVQVGPDSGKEPWCKGGTDRQRNAQLSWLSWL